MTSVRQPGLMSILPRLSRTIYRRATPDLLGMSLKEYMALNNVREIVGATQQALCESLHLDPNNCVLLLNALEDAHLIVRRRSRLAEHRRRRAQCTLD